MGLPRIFALGIGLLGLAAAGVTTWRLFGLEFGDRPVAIAMPAASDVKFVDANGIHFGYLEQGTGPLVLLFHGYPETARAWMPVQVKLAAAGYHVVAPFMRGYAPTSSPPNGDYTVDALGQDVLGLIDAFAVDHAIIVGHDWGASAVYAAATKDPTKIKAIVAVSIPHPRGITFSLPGLLKADHFLYYQLPWARRIVWSHDFAHIDRIYARWAPNFSPPSEVLQDVKATLRAPGGVEGALGYYWSFFAAGSEALAADSSITVPAGVIAGAADGTIDIARFEDARPAFAGSYTFVRLDNVGHFPETEAPDKVADAILSFLRGIQ